jgi:hypothetical protein
MGTMKMKRLVFLIAFLITLPALAFDDIPAWDTMCDNMPNGIKDLANDSGGIYTDIENYCERRADH